MLHSCKRVGDSVFRAPWSAPTQWLHQQGAAGRNATTGPTATPVHRLKANACSVQAAAATAGTPHATGAAKRP
eukprot:9585687-Lingulodinium_polyedra.AAC.1